MPPVYETCPKCFRRGFYHPANAPRHEWRCRYCGHKVSRTPEPPLQPTHSPTPPYRQERPRSRMNQSQKPFPVKRVIAIFALIILTYILCFQMFGINDAGHRTVIQYPWGSLSVKFDPGLYWKFFGKTTVYNDVMTFDFAEQDQESGEGATIDQPGVGVKYRDGGLGTVFGLVRFRLPKDEPTMLDLHRAVRSNDGVAFKILKPVTEEALNLTAGLMTSEEAYADQRAQFIEWADGQIRGGKYLTEQHREVSIIRIPVPGQSDANGMPVYEEREEVDSYPVIRIGEDGRPLQVDSDLQAYGISVDGTVRIQDWTFEPATLDQISRKREAKMAVITARAEAERARQDAMTAQALGETDVTRARYEQEVIKARAVVEAEQEAAVIQIQAEQRVAVAEQQRLEAEQLQLAAEFYRQEQILRGEGESEYRRLLMEADGALSLKLDAYTQVMIAAFEAMGQQQWVPELWIQNGEGVNGGSEATNLINLLTAKVLQDLGLDFSMPDATTPDAPPSDSETEDDGD